MQDGIRTSLDRTTGSPFCSRGLSHPGVLRRRCRLLFQVAILAIRHSWLLFLVTSFVALLFLLPHYFPNDRRVYHLSTCPYGPCLVSQPLVPAHVPSSTLLLCPCSLTPPLHDFYSHFHRLPRSPVHDIHHSFACTGFPTCIAFNTFPRSP